MCINGIGGRVSIDTRSTTPSTPRAVDTRQSTNFGSMHELVDTRLSPDQSTVDD